MNDADMNNAINQINNMLKNNSIPEELKSIINNLSNSSNNQTINNSNNKSSHNYGNSANVNKNGPSSINNNFNFNSNEKHINLENDAHSSNDDSPEIDINTILKMKQIMDAMNSNKDDPRSNLLMSLKPYLKSSRREKVDQYVKLFSLGKAFETFNILGGEKKNDV